MFRLFRNKKGQNTAEYALLIALVVAAIIAMQEYTKRALQARVRDANVYMTETQGTGNETVSNFKTTTQYVPYYEKRDYTVARESVESSREGNGLVARDSSSTRTRTGKEEIHYGDGVQKEAADTEMPNGL